MPDLEKMDYEQIVDELEHAVAMRSAEHITDRQRQDMNSRVDAIRAELTRRVEVPKGHVKFDDGRVVHIPLCVRPDSHDVQRLMDYIEWHGPMHEHDCPEDDTCHCSAQPIHDSVSKCARFLHHYVGGLRAAARAAQAKGVTG